MVNSNLTQWWFRSSSTSTFASDSCRITLRQNGMSIQPCHSYFGAGIPRWRRLVCNLFKYSPWLLLFPCLHLESFYNFRLYLTWDHLGMVEKTVFQNWLGERIWRVTVEAYWGGARSLTETSLEIIPSVAESVVIKWTASGSHPFLNVTMRQTLASAGASLVESTR